MDIKLSVKEERVYSDTDRRANVFDVYPIVKERDGRRVIMGLEVSKNEAMQGLNYSIAKQKGRSPMDRDDGVSWEEALIGEVSALQVISEIQTQAYKAGRGSSVAFNTQYVNGIPVLGYKIGVI